MQSKLSIKRRQQLLLLSAQGLSQKEIAAAMGISPAGVTQLIGRMRAAGYTVLATQKQRAHAGRYKSQYLARPKPEAKARRAPPPPTEPPFIAPPTKAQLMARR